MIGLVARHSCLSVSFRSCRTLHAQTLLRTAINKCYGSRSRPSWVAMAKAKKSRRQDREERQQEVDLDSTNELMEQMEQQIDIDVLLNDEQAMAALRNKLLSEMRAHHSSEAATTPAAAAPRGRVFDSDEYDLEALEAGNETDSIDEIAKQAAHRLAMESNDIAEHIRAEHKHDAFMDMPPAAAFSTATTAAKQQQQQQQQQREIKQIRVPAGILQQPQQQQSAAAAKERSKTGSSDSKAGRSGGKQNGSSSSSSSASGGSSRSDGSGGAKLSGDTAIGRVVEANPGGTAVVVLKKGKARLFESGSPMVYSGAVECVIGRPPPTAGDVVVVADYNMLPIAWGVYNPVSMFRVRIMQLESEALADDSVVLDVAAVVELRVRQAVALRVALGLPGAGTDAYRLLNSEGDRLSGVVADVLGRVVVVQSSAAWSERYKHVITETLLQHTGCDRVVWRPAATILKEEGVEIQSENSQSGETSQSSSPVASQSEDAPAAAAAAQLDQQQQQQQQQQYDATPHSSQLSKAVQVHEAGLTFLATPEAGQKTGFYADQRLNRAFIASMAAGKTVLDLCCYSGGFGLTAAAAGAAAVTGVDSSASAVELATANAELNGLSERCAFVRDDVSTFLRAALEAGQGWDIVILDPPKLAPSKASLARATQKYKRLNVLALGVVRSGGIFMTCSCSGAMTQSGGLSKIVQGAAAEAERQVTLLSKCGAAPDHPLHPAYPEGEYLTALTYRVV